MPASMLSTSPSFNFCLPGTPWTATSFTEVLIQPGKPSSLARRKPSLDTSVVATTLMFLLLVAETLDVLEKTIVVYHQEAPSANEWESRRLRNGSLEHRYATTVTSICASRSYLSRLGGQFGGNIFYSTKTTTQPM